MAAIHQLRKQWQEEAAVRPFYPYLHIDDDGLVLGAGTLLAPMIKDHSGAPLLALDGDEQRIIALLSLAYRRPVSAAALNFIKRASAQWAKGEKALAHFELAYARLPRFETRDDARHLFYADRLLRKGVSARALMFSQGLDTRDFDLLKYNADQPRVPAGSGRESGQWTAGGGSYYGTEASRHARRHSRYRRKWRAHHPGHPSNVAPGDVISDILPDPIGPGQQYAQRPKNPNGIFQLPVDAIGGGGEIPEGEIVPQPTEGPPPSLPEFFKGGKTSGVLRTQEGDVNLQSGWDGPASLMPPGSPGFDIVTKTHVEGHAAALMKQRGITDGTLYINNPTIVQVARSSFQECWLL